jgi:thiol-disulfide isomerase/thioredoxin
MSSGVPGRCIWECPCECSPSSFLGLALAGPDFGRWYPFAEAQALAQAHGRVLMVYFHSPACPYCEQMNTFVLSDPQVDALLKEPLRGGLGEHRHPRGPGPGPAL